MYEKFVIKESYFKEEIEGKFMEISGKIVLKYKSDLFIVEQDSKRMCFDISDTDLVKKIFSTVPVYVGGPAAIDDCARFVVEFKIDDKNKLLIKTIKFGIIMRDENIYLI